MDADKRRSLFIESRGRERERKRSHYVRASVSEWEREKEIKKGSKAP